MRETVILLAGAIAIAAFILVPVAGLVAVVACIALGFVILLGDAFRGKTEAILVWWAAVFPLGYYFGSFPREHPIATLDRVMILVAFIGLFFAKPSTLTAVPLSLRQAGLALLAFVAVAGVSLRESPNVLNGVQNLFEGFVLPALLGWCVIAMFDVRGRLPAIHTALCISSMICAFVAAAEIVTGQDLLPIGAAAMAYGGIVRPNGPFESNDTLALIGAISLFFLLFLRAILGPNLSTGRRVLHSFGLAAAIGMALMPMFRSVVITLLVVLIFDTFWEKRATRRAWRLALMLAFAGLIFLLPIFAPDVFEDRSRGENAYARVAEYGQSLRVFVEHPVLGVGLLNFNRYVAGEPRYRVFYQGVSSVDWPHSNLAQILAETGLLGFVPYVMAHVLLLRAMWKLRPLPSGHLVWKYYVYFFLTYWITGLTESSGYSPLNLVYMFAVAISYKYVMTKPESVQPMEAEVPDSVFNVPSQAY